MTTEEVRDNVRKILREQYFSEEEAMVDEIIIAMAKEKTDLWWKRLKAKRIPHGNAFSNGGCTGPKPWPPSPY